MVITQRPVCCMTFDAGGRVPDCVCDNPGIGLLNESR